MKGFFSIDGNEIHTMHVPLFPLKFAKTEQKDGVSHEGRETHTRCLKYDAMYIHM